jgi:hypothetical protein
MVLYMQVSNAAKCRNPPIRDVSLPCGMPDSIRPDYPAIGEGHGMACVLVLESSPPLSSSLAHLARHLLERLHKNVAFRLCSPFPNS